MENTLQLKAEIREHTGSKYAERLRKAGRVPAIIYGHKQKPVAISLDQHDFVEGLHHGHRLLTLDIDGKHQQTLVKDLQHDHLGKDIIHADLLIIDVTEVLKITVPIELKGTAKGISDGGIVEGHLNRIEIECKATDIPEKIVVSVKELEVGQSLYASDIELPQGTKLVTPETTLIANCNLLAIAKSTEELEAETPETPEVIGEKEPEEQQEENQEKSE